MQRIIKHDSVRRVSTGATVTPTRSAPVEAAPAPSSPGVRVPRADGRTEAARRAHLSKTAVSKAIKRLEARLEVTLFDRSTHHVELSHAGAQLLEHARGVLDAVEALGEALEATDGRIRGELRIGACEPFTAYALPSVASGICSVVMESGSRSSGWVVSTTVM